MWPCSKVADRVETGLLIDEVILEGASPVIFPKMIIPGSFHADTDQLAKRYPQVTCVVSRIPSANALGCLSSWLGSECDVDSKNLHFFLIFLYFWNMLGTVSSKGPVTIPKYVRDALGIEPGNKFQCGRSN